MVVLVHSGSVVLCCLPPPPCVQRRSHKDIMDEVVAKSKKRKVRINDSLYTLYGSVWWCFLGTSGVVFPRKTVTPLSIQPFLVSGVATRMATCYCNLSLHGCLLCVKAGISLAINSYSSRTGPFRVQFCTRQIVQSTHTHLGYGTSRKFLRSLVWILLVQLIILPSWLAKV